MQHYNRRLGILSAIGIGALGLAGAADARAITVEDAAQPKMERHPPAKVRVRTKFDEERIRLAAEKRQRKGARLRWLVERGGFAGAPQ